MRLIYKTLIIALLAISASLKANNFIVSEPKDTIKTFRLTDTVFKVDATLRKNIVFDYNGGWIMPSSFPFMDSLINFLNTHKNLKIGIGFSIDSLNIDKYNLSIFKYRASIIYLYLNLKGNVNKNQMKEYAYIPRKPIITQGQIEKFIKEEEKERATYRSVEFKIIRIDLQ